MSELQEIRAFLERAEARSHKKRFLRRRRSESLAALGDRPGIVLSAVAADFRDDELVDIHDEFIRRLMANPPGADGFTQSVACGHPYSTLEGLEANQNAYWGTPSESASRLVVFRNGYAEFAAPMKPSRPELVFAGLADTAYIVSFVRFAATLYQHLPSSMPIEIRLSVFNARGMWLAVHSYQDRKVHWPRQHLELGPFLLADVDSAVQPLIKQMCDRLWNAFHYDESNVFDADGNLRRS